MGVHSKVKQKEIEETIHPEDTWEPIGPTPLPSLTDLRHWDMRLLRTYKPFYAPFCDLCCLCTYGKCDLTEARRGACGIDIATQQARIVLLACCMGLAAHAGHARHVVDYLIDKLGEDHPIDLGSAIAVEAPNIRTVLGLKPKTLGDLRKAIEYVEREFVHLVSATHFGQEGHYLDYESKALHAGMLDHVAMEVADIAQIVGFNFPASQADTPLVDIGWGAVDKSKPIILVVGHNPATSTNIVDALRKEGLEDQVEVCGICCTAIETTRYTPRAKIIGPLSRQLFFVRTGLADVIVTDEQCIRTDIWIEAKKVGSALIATSDKACYGLEDATDMPVDEIVRQMVEEGKQFLILDHEKAGEVAVKVALKLAPKRKKELITAEEAKELAKNCRQCGLCEQVCPNMLGIGKALKDASEGNFEALRRAFERCIGCGKCEQECPRDVPIFKIFQAVMGEETWKIRAGRGPIMDTEIRKVGAPIVLGTIPGVLAFIGCSNFPDAIDEVALMVEEFAKRNYIITLSGCSAMVAAMRKDAEGRTVYEKFPPDFDAGGVVNVGSCVANSHISGAAIKIANIFANLPLRANYEVIADYIINRIGACGIAWGAMSQKAASIATGFNRWGIPALLGPHSSKYRRQYLSYMEEDDWTVMDGRERKAVDTQEPAPVHLCYVVETLEQAMVMIPKLCIRHNDTPEGRAIKLFNYCDLHLKYKGTLPDDLHLYVRSERDIPIFFKSEILEFLKEKGWQEKPTLSLPTFVGTYKAKVPIEAVIGRTEGR